MSTLSEKVKQHLSSLPFWERMAGSQFVQGVALLTEKVGESFAQRCERALAESRFSTATKRSSILAGAQDKGYVPRKVTPSLGKANITNVSGISLGIPIGTKLTSQNGVPYILLDAINLDVAEIEQAEIAQIEIQTLEYPITDNKSYLEILLSPELSAIAHKVIVYVKESDDAGFIEWQKSFMFRNATPLSTFYTEFYTPLEQLGFRFGNGIDGRIPPTGCTIKLEVWCTNGGTSLMQGEPLSFENETFNEQCSVVTATPIVGGQQAEDTESVRVSAQYSTQYDNQIVWGDDYIHFIRENIGQFSFLNVWGEEEQEKQDGAHNVANINTVFISANHDGLTDDDVKNLILPRLEALNRYSRKYKFVTPILTPIPVTIKAKLPVTITENSAKNQLVQMLERVFGRTRESLPDGTEVQVLEKNIWHEIEQLDMFDDFVVEVALLDTKPKLEEYRYIDTANSTFTISYKDIQL